MAMLNNQMVKMFLVIFLVQLYVKLPGLVNDNKKLWKDPPCLVGKLTISMVKILENC